MEKVALIKGKSGSVNAVTSKHQQLEIEAINEIDVEEIVDQNQAGASKSFNVVSSQHQQLEIEVDSTDHSTVIDPSFSTGKSDSKDAILDKQKSDAPWKCANQIQVQEPELPSTKSGELHPALESEVLVFSQYQHLQPGTNKQAGVITDNVTVRGPLQDPNQDSDPTLSSAKFDSVLKLENQKTFLSDHEQLEVDPYSKRNMVAENFKAMFEDQSHYSYQGASSSKSSLVHLISESGNLPLSDSLQLKAVTSKQTAAKTESGVEGMEVDQISHDLDEARQPLKKDSHAHYEIESKGSLESEQQLVQTEIGSQVASINNTLEVAVSKNELPSSSTVSQFRLASFSGKRYANRVVVEAATKNIAREMVAIESHDPDQTLSTAHSSEFHPSYDNKETLSSEKQRQALERSPDKPAITESCGASMDVRGCQDHHQTMISNTSYENERKESILTSNQELKENESNTPITGSVHHNIVADSDHLVSVSCEAVEKRHQETPAGRSLDDVAVALPVDDDMLRRDRSKIQRLYSSTSVQVDLQQDNLRVTPLCEWQEHNCKQNARMTVNGDDRKVADQRESSLEQIALNKSSSGSQQVQTETSNQMAVMAESGRFSNQTAGMTENDRDKMVVGQKESPPKSAIGVGETLFLPETKTNFSSRCQLEPSIQMAGTTGSVEEMDVDEKAVNSVSLRETDQTHSTFENKTVSGNKHQQLYSMKSIRVSAMAENVNDQWQNQDPHAALTSSNQVGWTAESITEEGYPSQTIESGHMDVSSEKETILTNEHQQTPTGQCPHQIPVLSTSYDQDPVSTTSLSFLVCPTLENEEPLPSQQQPQAASSNQEPAMKENVSREGLVENQSQNQVPVPCSTKSEQIQGTLKSEETVPIGDQQAQAIKRNKEIWMVENDVEMLGDRSRSSDLPVAKTIESAAELAMNQTVRDLDKRLPSGKSSHVHLKLEPKGSFQGEENNIETESVRQATVMTGGDKDQASSSSKSGNPPLSVTVDERQEARTSKVRVEVHDRNQPSAGQIQDRDSPMSASKSVQAELLSDASGTLRRKHQDEETKNSLNKGDITETSEERMLVDKSEIQLGSPSNSGQVHLASEMNQAAPSRYAQSGHETLSQTGISENAGDGIVLGQRQSQGVSSRKEFGQRGPNSEIRTTLPNDIEEMEANTRNQIVMTTETTYSLKVADLSRGQLDGLGKESGQVHDTPMSRSPLHESRKIQAEKSTQTAVMTDIGNDVLQDADPGTCSNYARTSGLTYLKTEMWKKLKFSTRVLKGHTGLVCGVDCRNSLLVSGG